jgi:hypothetical protein
MTLVYRQRWRTVETLNAGSWEDEAVGPALIRGLLMHCDARQTVADRDWSPGPDTAQVRDIPEGTLVLARNGKWGLGVLAGSLLHPLAQGTLGEVEVATQEVVLFGLPGGVSNGAAPGAWSFDDGSLQRVSTVPTMRGTYRIMIGSGGRGILVFVRVDYHVVYLGAGELDELKATADVRLAGRHDEILRVRCAGQTHELNGFGRRGIVGQALLVYGGVRVMLAQVENDRFELYYAAHAGACQLVGEYRGADLERGDLGELHLSGPAQRGGQQRRHDEHEHEHEQHEHRRRHDVRLTDDEGVTRPPRSSPHQSRAAVQVPTPRPALPPLPSPEDYDRLTTCLAQVPTHGEGVSEMVNLYLAFRELVTRDDLENLLLWSSEWQALIEAKTAVRFGHGTRTFTRALSRFLVITGLGEQDGRRFWVNFGDLRRRGDSEVWATIRERFLPMTRPKPTNATPPPAETATEAVVLSDTAAPSSTPAAETAAPTSTPATETAVPSSTPPTETAVPSSTPPTETAAAAPTSTPPTVTPPTETAAPSSTPLTMTAAPSSTPPTETAAPSSTPPTETAAPLSTPPTETQEMPAAFRVSAPFAGTGAPDLNSFADDHARLASMDHSGVATDSDEAHSALYPDAPTGAPLSYLHEDDRWKPTRDRSWKRDAPSEFAGKIRGPPKK